MTWKHVALFALGSALAITGAFTGTSAAMLPIATLILGAASGHAQAEMKLNGKHKKES